MRIGIFGGSFDPVHLEHFNLAKRAIESLSLDKLIVMPAHTPPHKKGKTLTSNLQRLEMCKLAFAPLKNVEISDYEITSGGISYTYLTCEHFKKIFPTAKLFWLVGTDMLRDFPNWKYPERILENVELAVCARAENAGWVSAEQDRFFKRFSNFFSIIDYNGKEISSTFIRVKSGADEDVAKLVGDDVAKYIKKNGLYKIDGAKEALALLTAERKAHSLRVAYMAAKRAPSLGVPERVTIQAALFHDCAKYLPLDHEFLEGFECTERIPAPVLHQFTGAYLARTRFGITDKDVLNAISYHTSGRACMSALEKLIFLSDMLEEGRDFAGIDKLRELFWDRSDDLTKCMAHALSQSLEFLREKGGEVYALTVQAANYYKKLIQKENGHD
ncbi:MAG: nicotinate (nicotinamide) nucleotide adenylyltransferase [Clostridia bacterium]|nr:nicotinate (nicotinamide) nucleotide adenylyltransferase [Clostridia bacterium]